MEKALITGGTGFVGASLARILIDNGLKLKALVRKTSDLSNLKDLDLEFVKGDFKDFSSLTSAVSGCDYVFHVGADYRLWAKNPQDIYDNNVKGTENLLKACQKAGVKKIVYTSSVATIGKPSKGQIADENDIADIAGIVGHYKRSKFLAEQRVMEMAGAGVPVTIVNPSTPIGAFDIKPTPTGKIIVDFLTGKMPAYMDTGLNFVDVNDVARGHWLALKNGQPGVRYILGGENLSLRQFLEGIGDMVGKKPPKFRIPYTVAYALGWLNAMWSEITGFEPRIPLEGVRMAKRLMFFSSSKAENELNYTHQPIKPAIQQAIQWFKAHEYI